MEVNPAPGGKTLVVVAGPTAVGKTALCLWLAQELDTEILSADSRQFYREMNIGTAKPAADELAAVPHHFIDSHSISEEYNAGAYEADALQTLADLFQTRSVALLTGGSGLYIRAVCEGMDQMPEADPQIRLQLLEQLQNQGLPALVHQLQQLDPAYCRQADLANPQRVVRALEVCLASGQPYSAFRLQQAPQRPFQIIKIGLDRDRAELYQRIDARMDLMIAQGLLEEARTLFPFRHHNALQTVGYKEIFDFLEGQYDWEEALRLLKRNSRRYAKRQLTWFRRDAGFTWFHPDDRAAILAYIRRQLPAAPKP
ncbi:MAG: tRNA (adenosine(37)-N6)-dimethylallyltransferase MiaA [Adhaeribacter sp.]